MKASPMIEGLQVVALLEWMTGRLVPGSTIHLFAIAKPHGYAVAVAERADLLPTEGSHVR